MKIEGPIGRNSIQCVVLSERYKGEEEKMSQNCDKINGKGA